ncbi:hypothetical protein M2396_000682 [Pseudomonas sp. BIGb0278]|uniref:hypothetical protein n=1 Tax=Pseudomonas sp. BIGb0278 TaxID=2940607 RepID=UPI00216831F4|nr:hypothetical protein [Pseudomonas sp. BIGb0278]MCS4282417.1 hypothetical protein [Pseudomonas sp. BIGb0278]
MCETIIFRLATSWTAKNMMGSSSERESRDYKLVLALGVLALTALFTVFYAYRTQFPGDFSTESGDWSDFGSYFGGVLGPIVSVLTLITVFKTVLLQREMIRIQDDTFRSQVSQAASLAADAQKARVDNRKSVVMDMIDKIEHSVVRDIESNYRASFEAIKIMDGMTNRDEIARIAEGVEILQGQAGILNERRNALQRLVFSVSMKAYTEIEEVDADFQSGMRQIRPDLFAPV